MDNQPGIGRLLGCLHHHARIFFHRELSRWGLAGGSHHCLLMLACQEGLSLKTMTEHLHYDKANITRHVQNLIDAGCAVRKTDDQDHRIVRIYLTPKGRALVPQLRKVIDDWSEQLTAGMPEKDKQEALRLLQKMAANILNPHSETLQGPVRNPAP